MSKENNQGLTYEIWLGDHNSHFDHGVAHLEDGQTVELQTWIHNASYCADSILIDHDDTCIARLRWFIYQDALNFYSVHKDAPNVIFHNDSKNDIKIDDFGILGPKESIKIHLYPKRTIEWADRKYNATTIAELEEAERMKVDPSICKAYSDIDELLKALKVEDEEEE